MTARDRTDQVPQRRAGDHQGVLAGRGDVEQEPEVGVALRRHQARDGPPAVDVQRVGQREDRVRQQVGVVDHRLQAAHRTVVRQVGQQFAGPQQPGGVRAARDQEQVEVGCRATDVAGRDRPDHGRADQGLVEHVPGRPEEALHVRGQRRHARRPQSFPGPHGYVSVLPMTTSAPER